MKQKKKIERLKIKQKDFDKMIDSDRSIKQGQYTRPGSVRK